MTSVSRPSVSYESHFITRLGMLLAAFVMFALSAISALSAAALTYLHLLLDGTSFTGSNDLSSILLLAALSVLAAAAGMSFKRG